MRRVTALSMSFVIGVALASPARGDGIGVEAMVRMMPEAPISYRGWPAFGYADLRAMEAAAGIASPADEAAYAALPEADRIAWQKAVLRLVFRPGTLLAYGLGMHERPGAMREAVGFDFFSVDELAMFGASPPHAVTVLAGGSDLGDPFELQYSLPARGFVLSQEALPTWWRFDDAAIAFSLTDKGADGDPFDGDMMTSARIAATPGLVVATHHWDDLRRTLAARSDTGSRASVAEVLVPLLDAAREAAGADAILLQAAAYWLTDIGLYDPAGILLGLNAGAGALDPQPDALREAQQAPEAPLPPYPVVLIADFAAADGEQIAILALPYAERADAEAASKVVAGRLATWNPAPGADGRSAIEVSGGVMTASVVDRPGLATAVMRSFVGLATWGINADLSAAPAALPEVPEQPGGAIALIVVRYRLPPPDGRPWGPLPVLWVEAGLNRAMTPLHSP